MEQFTATLKQDGRYAVIALPFNAKEVFGIAKGTIHVEVTIKDIHFRTKLVSKGSDSQIIIVDKKTQKLLGFQGVDMQVDVKLTCENQKGKEEVPKIEVSGNEMIQGIFERRSVRNFEKKEISEDIVNTILQAGFSAPSAKGKLPFDFIVIDHPNQLYSETIHNVNTKPLENAPKAILICGDLSKEGTKPFLYSSCGAVAQNMLLAIHSLGLGGVWIGVSGIKAFENHLIQFCKLPAKIIPVCIIAFGYHNNQTKKERNWHSSKIHYHKW
ncbi:nitroreductase family protein [Breznakia pachnodae]|uniref:Nitroreductase n=1 Tax=Breznakia pachnodae TaxID=265178 RepID=A0ABU0E5H8_9FIRM|nr:nitroreductase family protein [Breznakia pachnodae]MDQ0361760.1 nitroreductase [Breznakia pachnodae]